jgi:hypothetical protein
MSQIDLQALYQTMELEDYGPTIQVEWLAGRRIVAFKNEDNTRDGVDASLAVVKKLIAQIPPGQPLLMMVDARHNSAMITPYASQKLRELFQENIKLSGRTAVVIEPGPVGQIVRLFMRTMNYTSQRERQVFFTRDEAIRWLAELL